PIALAVEYEATLSRLDVLQWTAIIANNAVGQREFVLREKRLQDATRQQSSIKHRLSSLLFNGTRPDVVRGHLCGRVTDADQLYFVLQLACVPGTLKLVRFKLRSQPEATLPHFASDSPFAHYLGVGDSGGQSPHP